MGIKSQPTEDQELANAAYAWRKQCQIDLHMKLIDPSVTLEDAQWCWTRFLNAYEREVAAVEKVKASK